jgi:hypothetical protein
MNVMGKKLSPLAMSTSRHCPAHAYKSLNMCR